MADESIKITIGAVKTASVDRAFADIRKQAARIGQDLNRFLDPRKALKGLQEYRKEIEKVTGPLKQQQREREGVRQRYSEEERLARKLQRERERAERYVHSLRLKQLREEGAARIREEARAARMAERDAKRRTASMQRMARDMSWGAVTGVGSGLRMGRRLAGEIGRGIGLDLSPASYLQQSISNQSLATKISNNAFVEGGAGRQGTRVDPTELSNKANEIGAKYGFDPNSVLRGLEQFTNRTGDLGTARDLLDELTQIATATGSDLSQLYGTAGELANQLGDIPEADRAKSITELLKAFAGQGKLGAVELEDLSRYGARIAATAGLYGGDRMDNIKQLGALAQAARKFGGADSAAMAATSVARLATTFKTNARVAAFKDQGIDVFDSNGLLNNPIELIKKSLVATRNDPTEFNKLFMNIMGARGAEGLGNQFRTARTSVLQAGAQNGETAEQLDARAVAAGLKSIDEFMTGMSAAALSEQQIADSVKKVQETYSAQVNAMNIEFQKVAGEFLVEFLPTLRVIAPELKKFAHTIGSVTTWALQNPKTAIGAAITASIVKGGIEAAFRAGIEGMFSGAGTLLQSLLRAMFAGQALPTPGGKGGGAVVPLGGKKVPLIGAGLGATFGMAAAGLLAGGDSDVNMTPEQRAAKAQAQFDQRTQGVLSSGDAGTLTQELKVRANRQSFLEQRVAGDTASGNTARAAAYSKELETNNAALRELTRALQNLPTPQPGVDTQDGQR